MKKLFENHQTIMLHKFVSTLEYHTYNLSIYRSTLYTSLNVCPNVEQKKSV